MIQKVRLALALLLLLLGMAGYAFYSTSDQFGAPLKLTDLQAYESSKQFNGQQFTNQIPTTSNASFKRGMESLSAFLFNEAQTEPSRPLEVLPVTRQTLLNPPDEMRIIWFGHSTFLMQVQEMNLLLDPMLTMTPAPHPMLGSDRYSQKIPINIEDLPAIDAVLLSHDHYDHLDYTSIIKLDPKVGHYFVPLGVGLHLQHWGISPERITELDWWQTANLGESVFTLTPARHFSGRKFENRDTTLWGGWVVESQEQRVLFTGDSGYGPHFKEIGRRFGGLDLALVETSQYNKRWPNIHMMPEQGVQAAIDAKAKVMMPIHWGAFTLSLHAWNEPPERAVAEAKRRGQAIVVPKIGEILQLSQTKQPSGWWRDY